MPRTVIWLLAATGAVAALAGLPLSGAGAQTSQSWPTYLGNGARTGYDSTETAITPATAPNLTQRWDDNTVLSISAEPALVNGVVYVGAWDGNERAVSAATGTQLWSTNLGQTSANCPNPMTVGVASTATVHTITVNGTTTQAVFVAGGDGNFYALNASTGAVIWKTKLGTPPATFLWSSPLFYKGSIYEGIASLGDCPLVRGGVVRMNAATGTVQNTLYTMPAGCVGAGVWGSPTLDAATGDFYFVTGNPGGPATGGSCSKPAPLALAVVKASSSLKLLSSWQVPAGQLNNKDSDFGSTPTLFQATIGGVVHQMVGVQNKNGLYYAFDRSAISSGPLWHQRMAAAGVCPSCGQGDISPSAYDGQHLFVGSGTTTIKGVSCAGSIRALGLATGKTVWAHCLPAAVLGAVTAVPGVAFFGAGNTAYAVSTSTGAILWSHQGASGSAFWGAPSISNGQVYFGNMDGNLYAFGT